MRTYRLNWTNLEQTEQELTEDKEGQYTEREYTENLLKILGELLEDYDSILSAYSSERQADGWEKEEECEAATQARKVLKDTPYHVDN